MVDPISISIVTGLGVLLIIEAFKLFQYLNKNNKKLTLKNVLSFFKKQDLQQDFKDAEQIAEQITHQK